MQNMFQGVRVGLMMVAFSYMLCPHNAVYERCSQQITAQFAAIKPLYFKRLTADWCVSKGLKSSKNSWKQNIVQHIAAFDSCQSLPLDFEKWKGLKQ